jgi:anti-sigma regulatory factor (Ser/Thr protein kinase)
VTTPVRWRFVASSAAGDLRAASDRLDSILAARDVSHEARFAARLICEELVLNAFEHGRATFVTLDVDPDVPSVLVLEDDGAPFDPATPPDPRAPDTPGDFSPRGRGLSLVRGFAKAIEHERADGHNRVRVRFIA